jgi:hypothetical protein
MPNSDYIPSADTAFLAWVKNVLAYILQNFSTGAAEHRQPAD